MYATLFILALLLFEQIIFQQTPAAPLALAIYGSQPWQLITMIGSLVSLSWAVIYVRTSLTAPPYWKAVYFLLFSSALFFEYNYRGVFQRFSTAQDLLIALTPLDLEIGQEAIAAYANGWVIIPLLVYGGLLVASSRGPASSLSYPALKLLAVLTLSLLIHASLYLFNIERFPTVSLSAFFRTVTYALGDTVTRYNGPRITVQLPSSTRPTNNVIFIVDESIRADHLSVNGYDRPTTPYLEQLAQQGWLHNWGIGLAGGYCSLISNNLLLTGLNSLPDPSQQLWRWPTIFQYAQARGYRTTYFDVTSNQFWIGQSNDLADLDTWRSRDQFPSAHPFERDLVVAEQLQRLVSQSQGNFIWVNKRGLHFNYTSHYPPQATIWQPVSTARFDPAEPQLLINAYDNALRYNLNQFFERLIAPNPDILQNTVILYTADHSQTLSKQGETWTHCVGSRAEMMVPIFLLSQQPLTVNTAYRASHANLFATLLRLMDIPQSAWQQSYAPSLLDPLSGLQPRRRYFVGHWQGRDMGRWVLFD